MKITLTGASGFVGSHVLKKLSSNHEIQTLRHTLTPAELTQSISKFKPELVLHIGSLFVASHTAADIAPLIDSNVKWPTMVIEAAVQSGAVYVINTGTCWQSWENSDIPVTLYSSTKSAFESVLKYYSSAFGLKVLNLWLLDTYGPGDKRGKLISKLVQCFQKQESLEMSPGDQYLNLTHIDDICEAYRLSIELISNKDFTGFQTFEATHQLEIKLKDMLKIFEDVSGKKSPIKLGARPYRSREVMKPSHVHPRLPGWSAKIDFPVGLKGLFHEN